MFWNMGDGGWNALGFGMHGIGMLVFWGALIWLVVVLARTVGGAGNRSRPAADAALEVLAVRYAKGEISQSEFETIRRTLTQK